MDVKVLVEKLETAQALLEDIRRESGCGAFGDVAPNPIANHETAIETAVRAYEERRKRSTHFDVDAMFGEPAWDMLLDLYIHQARNEDVSIKSATIGSGASASTALRWIQALDAEGLIRSEEDPKDSKRRLLHLTPEGYLSITRYLQEISR